MQLVFRPVGRAQRLPGPQGGMNAERLERSKRRPAGYHCLDSWRGSEGVHIRTHPLSVVEAGKGASNGPTQIPILIPHNKVVSTS
jgi:hypothetical protein